MASRCRLITHAGRRGQGWRAFPVQKQPERRGDQKQDRHRLGSEELEAQNQAQKKATRGQPQQKQWTGHAARHSPQFSKSFNCLPARKRGWRDGLMVISSPVWGFLPLPPARVATTKTPKPVSRTSSPALRVAAMRSNTPSTALAASFLARPVVSASFWMRSFLFTGSLLVVLGRPAAGLLIRPLSGEL